jgi:hypothetical protein
MGLHEHWVSHFFTKKNPSSYPSFYFLLRIFLSSAYFLHAATRILGGRDLLSSEQDEVLRNFTPKSLGAPTAERSHSSTSEG